MAAGALPIRPGTPNRLSVVQTSFPKHFVKAASFGGVLYGGIKAWIAHQPIPTIHKNNHRSHNPYPHQESLHVSASANCQIVSLLELMSKGFHVRHPMGGEEPITLGRSIWESRGKLPNRIDNTFHGNLVRRDAICHGWLSDFDKLDAVPVYIHVMDFPVMSPADHLHFHGTCSRLSAQHRMAAATGPGIVGTTPDSHRETLDLSVPSASAQRLFQPDSGPNSFIANWRNSSAVILSLELVNVSEDALGPAV